MARPAFWYRERSTPPSCGHPMDPRQSPSSTRRTPDRHAGRLRPVTVCTKVDPRPCQTDARSPCLRTWWTDRSRVRLERSQRDLKEDRYGCGRTGTVALSAARPGRREWRRVSLRTQRANRGKHAVTFVRLQRGTPRIVGRPRKHTVCFERPEHSLHITFHRRDERGT